MIATAPVARLYVVQQRLRALVDDLDDTAYRTQFHPDLSPIGWHLGHCAFIENYWLREIVLGDGRLSQPYAYYYVPANSPKPQRGPALPPKEQLLVEVRRQHDDNLHLLVKLGAQAHAHPILENDYLTRFLVQHHAQHIETMNMARTQRALRHEYASFRPTRPLISAPVKRESHTFEAGSYWIGGEAPEAFDNELPAHRFACDKFTIATRPVSNAEYLGFIEHDGYRTRRHWHDAGWRWLQSAGCTHPEHWRQNTHGAWFGIDGRGANQLISEDPVYGISYYEAQAFAVWADARLPHEYEWEIAYRAGCLKKTSYVWEWCDNTFHPYEGFKPFPYDEYSLPWFDGAHYTLRGGSRYTEPELRRASFRNFYTAEKRHIFAGLRLVF